MDLGNMEKIKLFEYMLLAGAIFAFLALLFILLSGAVGQKSNQAIEQKGYIQQNLQSLQDAIGKSYDAILGKQKPPQPVQQPENSKTA